MMVARPVKGRSRRVASETPLPLTPPQRRFMIALQRRLAAFPDIGPTFDELRDDIGLKSKSGIARLVDSLISRGRIGISDRRQRSLFVIVPVSEDGGDEPDAVPLIQSFSHEEFLAEATRRGMVVLKG